MHIVTYLTKLFAKLAMMIHQPIAWIAGFGLFIADALTDGALTIYLVVVACVVDLICGIAVAIKRKRFTQSELMRLTVEKLLVYGLVLVVFLCIDKVVEDKTGFEWSLTSTLVGVVMTLTEALSFTASLLILFPKNPLLKLMQKALTAEIAGKLGVEKEEVDAIMAKMRRTKQPRSKNGQFATKKTSKKK